MTKPTVAVDWDGTCVANVWPEQGDWLPGAIRGLHKLVTWARVVIYTCRIAPVDPGLVPKPPELVEAELAYIRRMLDGAGLHEVEIHTDPWKPGAAVYLDDRAVRFMGDWGSALANIHYRLEQGTAPEYA